MLKLNFISLQGLGSYIIKIKHYCDKLVYNNQLTLKGNIIILNYCP